MGSQVTLLPGGSMRPLTRWTRFTGWALTANGFLAQSLTLMGVAVLLAWLVPGWAGFVLWAIVFTAALLCLNAASWLKGMEAGMDVAAPNWMASVREAREMVDATNEKIDQLDESVDQVWDRHREVLNWLDGQGLVDDFLAAHPHLIPEEAV